MEMLSSLRVDKHEFCLVVIKFNTRVCGDGKYLVYQLHMYIHAHKYCYVCMLYMHRKH